MKKIKKQKIAFHELDENVLKINIHFLVNEVLRSIKNETDIVYFMSECYANPTKVLEICTWTNGF